jgi:hypothetical protein
MVLNYKDSIKKEMELSAMLGENVDLSEARALFAAGKDDEGFKSLKDSGILEKAQAQGIFAVDLVNSLFPAQQLAKQPLEKGASAGIKSNEDFLKTLQNSLKDFEIGSAIINVQRAGLRELLQFAPGNKGDESVNQQLAKLRENAFSDAISTLVDIQKFALREGKIIGEVPVLGPPLKSALDLIEQPSGINNPYITGKFPKNNDKLFGTTPFLNPTNPQGTPAEQKERLKKAIEEIKNSIPKGGVIKGSVFDSNMSEVISQPLKISNTSLKSIDVQSTTQTGLLQNLQTIMATLANFTDPTFGLKLLIDGKDVKNRIEKIKTQEKGKTK